MNNNKLIKRIAIFLAIQITILSFPFTNIGYAEENFSEKLIVEENGVLYQSKDQKDYFLEVFKENKFYYFYMETSNDVKTFTLDSKNNKIIEAYYKKIDDLDNIIEYKIPSNYYVNALNQNKSIDLQPINKTTEDIKILGLFNNIFNEIQKMESVTIDTTDIISNEVLNDLDNESLNIGIEKNSSTNGNKAIRAAQNVYGDYIFNRYLGSGKYYNKTGYLYFTRTFGATKITDIWVAAGRTVSAISLLLGIPASGVKAIISLGVSAAGLLISLKPETVHTYKTMVHDLKEVKVGSYYPYRSLKDITGEVQMTDWGVSPFYYKKTRYSDNIYSNNQAIIKRGCELY